MKPAVLLSAPLLLFIYSFLPKPGGDRCNCLPAEKNNPYRYPEKHMTDFTTLNSREGFITSTYVHAWEEQYREQTKTLHHGSPRLKNTPEDTLYHLKGYLYMVKTHEDDCDLHLEVGTADPNEARCVLEISMESCKLQNEFLAELKKKKFKLNVHNLTGIPIEATGPGFYDGHHAKKKTSVFEEGSGWELHPLQEVKVLP